MAWSLLKAEIWTVCTLCPLVSQFPVWHSAEVLQKSLSAGDHKTDISEDGASLWLRRRNQRGHQSTFNHAFLFSQVDGCEFRISIHALHVSVHSFPLASQEGPLGHKPRIVSHSVYSCKETSVLNLEICMCICVG